MEILLQIFGTEVSALLVKKLSTELQFCSRGRFTSCQQHHTQNIIPENDSS